MRTNLKVFRVRLKLTQEGMAIKLGVSRQLYAFVEAGKRNGSPKFWRSVQRVFNVPDDQMYKLMKLDK